MLQCVDEHFNSAADFPLGIGVFHPQKQHAATLMRHTLRGQTLHQIAQMDKAGGGGRHACDNSAFGGLTQRVFFL